MQLPLSLIIFLVALTPHVLAQSKPVSARTVTDALEGSDLRIPSQRASVVAEVKRLQEERKLRGQNRARQLGLPLRVTLPGGTVQEVVDLDERSDQPMYFTTHNAAAGISTGANRINLDFGVQGAGIVIGMWDNGVGRGTHQEFSLGRMINRDGGVVTSHPTHVGGTMIAAGTVAAARGMAPEAAVDSYDWNNDISEFIARGAAQSNETDKLMISNHSYGYVRGWNWNGSRYVWNGFDGNTASDTETYFGVYVSRARSIDAIAYDAPYYLMFWSAGNERNNNPSVGSPVTVARVATQYDPALHPPGDGVYRGGFDTLGDNSVAKNVLTIGSVGDAVSSGVRDIGKAGMSSYSSWGPTDDGRIKPDLVANGEALYSSGSASDTAYYNSSGTSMATPNATGTGALLIDLYDDLFPGQVMRASTLKGLLIHTASDIGAAGPDYKNGWGLINGQKAAELLSAHADNPGGRRVQEATLESSEDEHTYQFIWDGTSPIRATLCWTDPEGNTQWASDSRNKNLVNDLNIKITGPDGAEHFPYVMPFVGTWTQLSMNSVATTGVNNTDNVEQVYIPSPQEGTYQITISCSGALTNNVQYYSLLLSGAADPSLSAPPVISPLENIQIEEDSSSEAIVVNVSDEQTPADELTVSASSSNQSVVDNGGILLYGSGTDRMMIISPVRDAFGITLITVTASDGELDAQEVFEVMVEAVNDAPAINITPSHSMRMNSTSEALDISISDVDNAPSDLQVTAFSSDDELLNNSGIILEGSGAHRTVTFTPLSGRYGISTVTFSVTDGIQATESTLLLEVENPHPDFNEWLSMYPGLNDVTQTGDPDGDNISNAMEYFFDLNPTSPDKEEVVRQYVYGDSVVFDYRRSRKLKGIQEVVKWSNSPDIQSNWTSQGLTVQSIDGGVDFDLRRVYIPWDGREVFVRLDIILE